MAATVIQSDTLRRLLSAIPEYLDRAPHEASGILIQYEGLSRITISNTVLRAVALTGVGATFSVPLAAHTLDSLAAEIGRHAGFSGRVITAAGATPAIRLCDADQDPLVDNRFVYSTSILWGLVRPIEWALIDAQAAVRRDHEQMTIPTAVDQWLDLWGRLYGRVTRRIGETDTAYSTRIIREFKRWRVNARAIEIIIEEDLGARATITHLHDLAWVIARTKWGRFPGPQKYLRTTFEVLVDGLTDGLASLVNRNRAAGTMPFLRMRDIGGDLDLDAPDVIGRAHTRDRGEVSQNGVWRIGVDPLGLYPIGIPRDIEGREAWLFGLGVEQITGTGSGTPFLLGASDLGGTDVLGEPAQGFALVEDEPLNLVML